MSITDALTTCKVNDRNISKRILSCYKIKDNNSNELNYYVIKMEKSDEKIIAIINSNQIGES